MVITKERLKNIKKRYEISDIELITQSLNGNKKSLDTLILRYQNWIYNLAIRMVIRPADAKDVTQEILIKIITHLHQYNEEKASFKTWLYRIAVNHIINMNKRGWETLTYNFDNYYNRMESIKDIEPVYTQEIKDTIIDTMIHCVLASLMCLNRQQRLVIILGVIFNINSKIGADILGITRSNFRKILSRSRSKLRKFMGKTCSLVNKKAKCKCHMKITDLINQGYCNPEKLMYKNIKSNKLVRDIIGGKVNKFMNKYFYKFNDLFQSQPFWEAPNMTDWLNQTIRSKEFKEIFNLNDEVVI